MDLGIKSTKMLGSFFLVAVMGVLAFFVIRPILFAVIGGLLLAYIFYPVYKIFVGFIKSRTLSAIIMLIIAVALLLIPLWFALPVVFKQIFQIYISSQSVDVTGVIKALLPTASTAFISQATLTANAAIGRAASSILHNLALDYTNITFLFNLFMQILVVGIVFFFALRDNEGLRKFADAISPLSNAREKVVIKQFNDITTAILYGYIVVGVVQGLCAGLGLFVFGIPSALALTLIAIILCILPFIGTPLIWIPATIYLFSIGRTGAAIAFLFYNILIVSTIDNILRAYIVSRRSNVSQVVILLGMIGGFILFGFLGIVLGPLILSYFITFLDMHKNSKLVLSTKK